MYGSNTGGWFLLFLLKTYKFCIVFPKRRSHPCNLGKELATSAIFILKITSYSEILAVFYLVFTKEWRSGKECPPLRQPSELWLDICNSYKPPSCRKVMERVKLVQLPLSSLFYGTINPLPGWDFTVGTTYGFIPLLNESYFLQDTESYLDRGP